MADTTTPNLGMTLVEVGASRDTWGSKLNANTSTLDQAVSQAMPVGAMLDFAGPNAPSGWLICDGRLISRTTYSALFAVISTYWGAGDGSTTFALPSTPGRASIGPGSGTDDNGTAFSYSFAQRMGALSRAIAQANLPAISLTANTVAAHAHTGVTAPGANHAHTMDVQGWHGHGMDAQGNHKHSVWSDNQGSHNHTYSRTDFPPGAGGVIGSGFAVPQSNQATSTDGAHAHNIDMDYQGNHAHNIYGDGNHQHNIAYSGNLQLGIYADGSHNHTVALGGSGTLIDIRSPLICVTKIIYAGNQAAVLMATAVDVTSQQRLSAPLRGGAGRLRLN